MIKKIRTFFLFTSFIIPLSFFNLLPVKAEDVSLTPEMQQYISASKEYLLSNWADKCIYLSLTTSPYTYRWAQRASELFAAECLMIYTTKDFGVKTTHHFALILIDVKNGAYKVATIGKGSTVLAGALEPLLNIKGKKVVYDLPTLLNATLHLKQNYFILASKNWVWVPVDSLGITKDKKIFTADELSQKMLNLISINQTESPNSSPQEQPTASTSLTAETPSNLPGWSYVSESLLCDPLQGNSKNECHQMVQNLKKSFPEPWHIRGDFNGDKIDDEAGLLINKDGERRLYVFLGKLQGLPEPVLLHNIGKIEEIDLYVALVKPGTSETYCSVNPDACDPDDAKIIKSKYPRIAFGLFEATQTDFYWNEITKKFENISMGD